MKRNIIITDDGSTTIHIPQWNEQYHSTHGAIQEAKHVFIKKGLNHVLQIVKSQNLSILEIGFGTGLNAYITLLEAEKLKTHISYVGVEAFPVSTLEIEQLNYVEQLQVAKEKEVLFNAIHTIPWEETQEISPYFQLEKQQKDFLKITNKNQFNIIYFDAFGARVQPELWTESVFKIMFNALKNNGVLVTYAAKGSVRRAMQAVGFTVERLEGPPGKREMLRATKK
ncbi:MAG: tRNA (5-methylaminomethyl-2-thiouridine)(34)-methyltransferase MnmD [Oceanihabitans sp.]